MGSGVMTSAGARWSVTEYRYRPAPSSAPDCWHLDGTVLSGPGGQLDLRTIDGAAFTDQTKKGWLLRRLDLRSAGQELRLGLVHPTDASSDAIDEHLAVLSAVAQVLGDLQPNLPIAVGTRRRLRLARFFMGTLALAVGLGIATWAAMAGWTGDRMALAALPMLGLGGVGVALMQTNVPWGTGLSLPAALFPAMLQTLQPMPGR